MLTPPNVLAVSTVLLLCAACSGLVPFPTPTPPITPSPMPGPKALTVCLPREPESLYLYGGDPAARHIWQAIYDGPLDSRSYTYQPVILTALPSVADGSAVVETIAVQAGERVLSASGDVVALTAGVPVGDRGGRRVVFDGTPVLMPRMVVTFTLLPGLSWSDGVPLTAWDSVCAFQLAADPQTPVGKRAVERTADYRAADAQTIVWTGVPGFLDHFYYLNFWPPLPRHAWAGLSAGELLVADVSARRPPGWGPFVIQEWVPGSHITVARNPHYFRALEGLPRLDGVTFRFVSDPQVMARDLLEGRCDLITHEAAGAVRAALPPASSIQMLAAYSARWELLAFGITPAADYDRPDFFEDVRVRQGIARCIDRQAVAEQVAGALGGRVLHSYIPPEHPLYAGEALAVWGYDPSAGQALLAMAGWYDGDGDGVREAHSIPGIADGTPFEVTYRTTDDPQRLQAAQRIRAYLAACGIRTTVVVEIADVFFAPGPEGALFGRRFDLAQFSWRAAADPLCDLFLSSRLPDTGRWDEPNVSGWLDDRYDVACLSAIEAVPGSPDYAAGHAEAQRIFSERLPVLPLFQHQEIVLARPSVIGVAPDATQASELWNVEQFDWSPR